MARLVENSTFTVDKPTAKSLLAFRYESLEIASDEKKIVRTIV